MVEEDLESGDVDYCIDRLFYERVCRNGVAYVGLRELCCCFEDGRYNMLICQ